MSAPPNQMRCTQAHLISVYALRAIAPDERSALEAHLSVCSECRRTLEEFRRVVDAFAFWPTDVLRPSETLRQRLASRIASDGGGAPVLVSQNQWREPAWEQVAPDIQCKLLATDSENKRVSMLVRLAPGGEYPPHTHAGREELYLLDGELWINDRKLYPGDYNRAEAGTADQRVWSETGCTCVLITSTEDVIAQD